MYIEIRTKIQRAQIETKIEGRDVTCLLWKACSSKMIADRRRRFGRSVCTFGPRWLECLGGIYGVQEKIAALFIGGDVHTSTHIRQGTYSDVLDIHVHSPVFLRYSNIGAAQYLYAEGDLLRCTHYFCTVHTTCIPTKKFRRRTL